MDFYEQEAGVQDSGPAGENSGEWTRIEIAELERELREALAARDERLRIVSASIVTPAPGAVSARTCDGGLVRIDTMIYDPRELER